MNSKPSWMLILGLTMMFAVDPVFGSCVAEGACYALSAEVVGCEEKDIGQKFLVVETKVREPKVVSCGYSLAREASGPEIQQNLARFRREKYFAVYSVGNMSCEKVPKRLEEVLISGGCCDTLPAKGPCALALPVLNFRTD